MINKKRVQRIKNLIYAFIILVLFLPMILVSILSFRLTGQIDRLSSKIDQLSAAVSSSSLPEDGYVIEPQGQNSDGGTLIPKTTEEKNQNATGENQVPDASGDNSEANGAPDQADRPSVGADAITQTNGEEPPEEAPDTPPVTSDDAPIVKNNISDFEGSKQTADSQNDQRVTAGDAVSVGNNPGGINGNPRMGR